MVGADEDPAEEHQLLRERGLLEMVNEVTGLSLSATPGGSVMLSYIWYSRRIIYLRDDHVITKIAEHLPTTLRLSPVADILSAAGPSS